MKDAVRGLASGEEKEFRKFTRLMREKFVFLNVYCRSVKDEHDPRGPEGPYRFQDRSVPVLLIKRWDGKTLKQQLGFQRDARAGRKTLALIMEKAVKENGPVAPPKALRPLVKDYQAGIKALERKRIKTAVAAFQKVFKGAADKKKFRDGPPTVAIDAGKQLERLQAAAEKELAAVLRQAGDDPTAARKQLIRLSHDYGGFPDLKKRMKKALADLSKP